MRAFKSMTPTDPPTVRLGHMTKSTGKSEIYGHIVGPRTMVHNMLINTEEVNQLQNSPGNNQFYYYINSLYSGADDIDR